MYMLVPWSWGKRIPNKFLRNQAKLNDSSVQQNMSCEGGGGGGGGVPSAQYNSKGRNYLITMNRDMKIEDTNKWIGISNELQALYFCSFFNQPNVTEFS